MKTRVDLLQSDLHAEGVVAEAAMVAPGALVVREGHPIGSRHFAAGEFIVQDEASQLVAHLAGVGAGERVLDACASPGGKSVVMACDAGGSAKLAAADVRPKRIALLRETLVRTGVKAQVLQMDLRHPLPFAATFDCVLVDAPCSGMGTIRRDPDIKWRRREEQLLEFAAVQAQLIRHAAAVVSPGGRLVYATCSSEPEENDEVVDAFLAEQPEFAAASDNWLGRNQQWSSLSRVCDDRGRLSTLPHQHGLEAFFAAVLVKAKRL
jgi:16S rRNA (cytosine967-C5)-methyltransferase